ncbi:Ig-like domain-containing protein [Kitasatospora cineracea]|uniref:L,D-transpeptidase n=1 Tax=Kitasatospora TaxID=2063 RepID=UPI002283F241|nr:Ig-like domain-containing protein [Kitasatospora sp. YST-16]WAL73607.1 Ig-like domain-containing protein [Kitasatospora sp. YST-16]WNW39664.1 Ig-like domain-containing protein [Streptomyces sp. Li-HN-5-13]
MDVTAPEKQDRPRGGNWSRRGVLSGLLGAPVLLVAACSGGGGKSGAAGASGSAPAGGGAVTESPSTSPKASVAQITVKPADGATAAPFTEPVTVTVLDGTLTSVTVTDGAGRAIAGQLAADGASWTSTAKLSSGSTYTVAAAAVDKDQRPADANASFSTASPANTFVGYFTPEDGSTVGVGMPVSINFNKSITDRKAVQQAITVVADPPVEIVGHWFDSTRLDFRPQEYWAKGTKVTLKLRLKDVAGARGVYGTQSKDVTFTVGRSQVSTADLKADTLTVRTDGQVTATYPVIGGAPEHRTWGGKLVISEKYQQTRMNSSTVGLGSEYDIPDVPHAQRLTTSGTFIHGNYWSPASQFGNDNTSHGCIALQDVQGGNDPSTNAAAFYASSMIGDVVEVVNSGDRTVNPGNGLNGWNMAWADWVAGSAV